jgi:hypothetical protein
MKSTNVDYLDDRHCENEPGSSWDILVGKITPMIKTINI